MPFDIDEDDTNSLVPTPFDLQRLEAMAIGDTLEGELGNWKVMKYEREYLVLLNNRRNPFIELPNLKEVIVFLNKKRK